MDRARPANRRADGVRLLVLYAALWALFSGGGGWTLGLPSVLLATAVSLWLGLSPLRLRLSALPGFVWFIMRTMISGAWDVARRALHPGMPVQPAWLDYRLRSDSPRVCLLLSALVGLLPGTLVARIDGDRMRVHVLDQRQQWRASVIELESRLARLLGADLR